MKVKWTKIPLSLRQSTLYETLSSKHESFVTTIYLNCHDPLKVSEARGKVGMPDIQNFFHKALAVVFAKAQYLYSGRKLSVSSIECYHFPVAHSMYAEVTVILIFSHTNFH